MRRWGERRRILMTDGLLAAFEGCGSLLDFKMTNSLGNTYQAKI